MPLLCDAIVGQPFQADLGRRDLLTLEGMRQAGKPDLLIRRKAGGKMRRVREVRGQVGHGVGHELPSRQVPQQPHFTAA
jgi:hypothetical protein